MRTLAAVIVLLIICITAKAQRQCALQGRVTGHGYALPGAGVSLFTNEGKQLAAAVTDSNGFFCMGSNATGTFRFRISSIGYQPYERSVTIKGYTIETGTIALSLSDSILKEIVISGHAAPVIQKHDTTEYAAGAWKLAEYASATTLIRKLPGVMTQNGTVKVQGEEVTRILVDGKPFFTGDLYAALATLPADMIDKVQVYRDKPVSEQLSGFSEKPAAPVINLVIKQNRKHSIFGNAYAGAGTQGRYLTGATVNTFSGERRASAILEANNIHALHYTADQLPGTADNTMLDAQQASLNYTDKWKKLALAATYIYNRNTASLETKQDRIYTQDTGLVYTGRDMRTATTGSHNFCMTLDYHADSANSLQVRPQWSQQQNRTTADMTGIMSRQGVVTGMAVTHNNANLFAATAGADALYVHKWSGARSLVLGAGYIYNTSRTELVQAMPGEHTPADTMHVQTGTDITEATTTANAAYGMPLKNAGQVQLQYELNSRHAASERYNYSSPDPLPGTGPHTGTVNHFTAASLLQKAGVFYRYRKPKADVSLGVFAQYAVQELQQLKPAGVHTENNYSNLVPLLSAQYYITPAQNIQLMYTTAAALPELMQLQPVTDVTNPMLLYAGNAALKQVYQHNLSFRYSGVNAARQVNYFVLISGCLARNYISNSMFFAEKDTLIDGGVLMQKGAQLQKPVNMDGYSYLNITAGYGFPVWKLHTDLNINAGSVHVPVEMNGLSSIVQRRTFGADVSVSSNISSSVDITCSGSNTFHLLNNTASSGRLYYSGNYNLLFNLHLPGGLVFNAGVSYKLTRAPEISSNGDMILCNLGIGRQFWKERVMLRLLVYDCTGQNKNIAQFVTDTYTEQVWRNAMQRYCMLALSCNFHKYQ